MRTRIATSLLATLFASVCVTSLAGCATTGARLDPPAESVRQLLVLRSQNSTDAAAYRAHVTTDLAEKFARDSAMRKPIMSPIPAWKSPVITREATSSAQVRVEWVPAEKYKAWPAATLFTLLRDGGLWRVVDAVDTSATVR